MIFFIIVLFIFLFGFILEFLGIKVFVTEYNVIDCASMKETTFLAILAIFGVGFILNYIIRNNINSSVKPVYKFRLTLKKIFVTLLFSLLVLVCVRLSLTMISHILEISFLLPVVIGVCSCLVYILKGCWYQDFEQIKFTSLAFIFIFSTLNSTIIFWVRDNVEIPLTLEFITQVLTIYTISNMIDLLKENLSITYLKEAFTWENLKILFNGSMPQTMEGKELYDQPKSNETDRKNKNIMFMDNNNNNNNNNNNDNENDVAVSPICWDTFDFTKYPQYTKREIYDKMPATQEILAIRTDLSRDGKGVNMIVPTSTNFPRYISGLKLVIKEEELQGFFLRYALDQYNDLYKNLKHNDLDNPDLQREHFLAFTSLAHHHSAFQLVNETKGNILRAARASYIANKFKDYKDEISPADQRALQECSRILGRATYYRRNEF